MMWVVVGVVVVAGVGDMQMQLISVEQAPFPSVCIYSPVEPKLGQYTQPNGLLKTYDDSETVISSRPRKTAADSHSAMFVMSSPEGQVPVVIV